LITIGTGFFSVELTAHVLDGPARTECNAAQTCIGRNGQLSDIDGPLLMMDGGALPNEGIGL